MHACIPLAVWWVQAASSAGWLDTIMNVLGRAKPTSNEPTEESIRRTHDYLR